MRARWCCLPVLLLLGCQPPRQEPPPPAPAAVAPAAAPAPVPAPAADPAAPAVEAQALSAAATEEAPEYKPADQPQPQQQQAAAPTPQAGQQAAEPVAELPRAAPKEVFTDSEPPDPVYEAAPPAPSRAHVWTPGFWDWAGTRWSWRAGMWRPRIGGLVYAAPHYEVVNGRVVYVRPHWAPRVAVRSYGGRVLVFHRPVRPVWYRPGMRYYVRPVIGVRVGSRPVGIYRHGGVVTHRVVVPPRAVRVVGHGPGMHVQGHPGVRVGPGPGMRVGPGHMGPRPAFHNTPRPHHGPRPVVRQHGGRRR